jgi:hypothetical protein
MGQVLIHDLDDELLADWRKIAAANAGALPAR